MAQALACTSCGASLDLPEGGASTLVCPVCNALVIVPEPLRSTAETHGSAAKSAQQIAQEILEIVTLAQGGQKIEAIKRYRLLFDVDLKVAKDAVEALAGGGTAPARVQQFSQESGNLAEVARLVRANQKIEAIKMCREITGLGLKEAKDLVDALERGASAQVSFTTTATFTPPANPYQPTLDPVEPGGSGGASKVIAVIIFLLILGIGLAAFFYWSKAPEDAVGMLGNALQTWGYRSVG